MIPVCVPENYAISLMEVVMGKKVLAIVSSPRVNGNTDMMVDSFLKGARDAMHRTEKIYLRDFHIEFCRGCGVCSSTRHCVIKDDMERIIDKLVDPGPDSILCQLQFLGDLRVWLPTILQFPYYQLVDRINSLLITLSHSSSQIPS